MLETFGYLDPGTGTFILQTIVAVGAGIAVVLKTFWRQIVGFVKPGSKNKAKPGTDKKTDTSDNEPLKQA